MPRDVLPHAEWRAKLALGFERRGARTVLASRSHEGPLVVQKPLYPEGDAVCQAIVVHPPGGIAGGDVLSVAARAEADAHVLLTTPGAAKWYRSSGAWAEQCVRLSIASRAVVEWLPQETIVFDGARASIAFDADLAEGATLIACEVVCLGRTGSGERFTRGCVRLDMRVARAGRLAWIERALLEPGSAALESPVGMDARTVIGTLFAAGAPLPDAALAALRAVAPHEGEGAVTRLPAIFLARYRGDSSEAAREYFIDLWRVLRPELAGLCAVTPRIWSA
jgi:urease accessory protein